MAVLCQKKILISEPTNEVNTNSTIIICTVVFLGKNFTCSKLRNSLNDVWFQHFFYLSKIFILGNCQATDLKKNKFTVIVSESADP